MMISFYADSDLWGDAIAALGIPPCPSVTTCVEPAVFSTPPDGQPRSAEHMTAPGRYLVELDLGAEWAEVLRTAGYEVP